jgi:Family of unknown function (DUF6114)
MVDIVGGGAYIWFTSQPGVRIVWFGVRFVGLSLDALGVVGIAGGILIVCFGSLFLFRPARHRLWGKFVIALAAVSFVTSFYGGIGVGIIAAVCGGVIGIRSDPTPVPNDPRPR